MDNLCGILYHKSDDGNDGGLDFGSNSEGTL